MSNINLDAVVIRYEDELLKSVIPFWEEHCPDREYGGFYNLLDRRGNVFDTGKYMWMQWRIIYMFAALFNTEYSRPEWLKYACGGFDFLQRHGKKSDGSYYFALSADGRPAQSECGAFTLFSESFAAIACAELFKATGDSRYRDEAVAALRIYRNNIQKTLTGAALPGTARRLALGHYMILVNVCRIMNEGLQTAEYDHCIDEAITMIFRFWHPEKEMMFEAINPDGGFDLNSADGRLLNPGHALETMWFIMQYAEGKGDRELAQRAAGLTRRIFAYGWDNEYGGIYYFKDAQGKPLLEPKSCLKIWWAHNEAAIAALYARKLTGDADFLEWFDRVDAWSWSHFRDPDYPEWFGYTLRDGTPCHEFKGSNWKTFFHLPRCLLTCIKLLKAIKE